jgi:hypothetical protein
MTVVLKLDTKPSVFEPIEVEIDGILLRVKEITLGGLEKIQALQIDLNSGSAAAIRQTLETLLDGDLDVLRNLPLAKLRVLIESILTRAISPTAEEKNGSGPGSESLPS